MKNKIKSIVRVLSKLFSWIPSNVWIKLTFLELWLIALSKKPEQALKVLFYIENRLYEITSKTACEYGEGIHPKHRLTNYHEFFKSRLKNGESVLDIGCGNGALAFDIAQNIDVHITGVELNPVSINIAKQVHSHSNVTYVEGDVLKSLPNKSFDVAIMSNVLEHIENRVEFLRNVQVNNKPKKWLIRVPLYERDWRVPLKEELGMDYRLDPTHFIEYIQEEFLNELKSAGLVVTYQEIRWGEIWCEATQGS